MIHKTLATAATALMIAIQGSPNNDIIIENGSAEVELSQVWVDPYVRRDGTFVPGHMRSRPDGNPYNNYYGD